MFVVDYLEGAWGAEPPYNCSGEPVSYQIDVPKRLLTQWAGDYRLGSARVAMISKDLTVSAQSLEFTNSSGNPVQLRILDDDVMCWHWPKRGKDRCSSPLVRCTAETSVKLSLAQSWGLAVGAVLAVRNKERHDLLGGRPLSQKYRQSVQTLLKQWWGIEDRESLYQVLTWLMFEGHNAEFLRITNLVRKLDKREYERLLAQVSDDERLRMKFVRPRVHSLKSIRGWDLGRYVSLCRWGYAAGYLTEKEAWAEILNVSRVLQSHFSSWKEYGENFLLGRRFYSLDQARDWATMTRIEHQLTTDAASPWVQIPWHTELD